MLIERAERKIIKEIDSYPPDPNENQIIAEQRIKIEVRAWFLRAVLAYAIAMTVANVTLIAHMAGAI